MENLTEYTHERLHDDMYVVVNQDTYPKSIKVKLSELRTWCLTTGLTTNPQEGSTNEA